MKRPLRSRNLTLFIALHIAVAAHALPDMVIVGDAGNSGDSASFGYGSVSYQYSIGKYEVTNAEYTQFLNAVARTDTYSLYNTAMAGFGGGITRQGLSGNYSYSLVTGMENKPVNYVSYWDAARYTNWLTNGASTGAEINYGVYSLGPNPQTVNRQQWVLESGGYAIATRDEWYKAAYYKAGSTNAGYWSYATRSDTTPTAANMPNNLSNQVCYSQPNNAPLMNVGSFSSSSSAYGTFDQNGNAEEWTEELMGLTRVARGGEVMSSPSALKSWPGYDAQTEHYNLGFRVISLTAVPEPSQYAIATSTIAVALTLRRRSTRRNHAKANAANCQ